MMLGKTIQKLRKQKGLTQAGLASEIHVTPGAISQWETGRTSPGVQQMFILANFFGITVEELSSGEIIESRSGAAAQVMQKKTIDEEMAEAFSALPDPQTKEEVLAYLRFRLGESKKT